MNSLSMQIKEKMVRTLLLNQDEFRFSVGLAQLFAGLVIMLFALNNIRQDPYMWSQCDALSKEPDFKGKLDLKSDPKVFPSTNRFLSVYVRVGFENIFNFTSGSEDSGFVFCYIVLYCCT